MDDVIKKKDDVISSNVNKIKKKIKEISEGKREIKKPKTTTKTNSKNDGTNEMINKKDRIKHDSVKNKNIAEKRNTSKEEDKNHKNDIKNINETDKENLDAKNQFKNGKAKEKTKNETNPKISSDLESEKLNNKKEKSQSNNENIGKRKRHDLLNKKNMKESNTVGPDHDINIDKLDSEGINSKGLEENTLPMSSMDKRKVKNSPTKNQHKKIKKNLNHYDSVTSQDVSNSQKLIKRSKNINKPIHLEKRKNVFFGEEKYGNDEKQRKILKFVFYSLITFLVLYISYVLIRFIFTKIFSNKKKVFFELHPKDLEILKNGFN